MNVSPKDPGEFGLRGHTVLIIDDEPANLGMMSAYLAGLGLEVLIARDGESGLERARHTQPDLILLDVVMPGISGFETCRRLRAEETTKDIAVIFMTALTDTQNKIKGFQLGAVDYITKPFQHEEVLARLTAHLRLRELTRKVQEAKEILEIRVEERTAELSQANEQLQAEIAERKRAEDDIRRLNRELEAQVISRNREMSALYDVAAVASEALDLRTSLALILGQVSSAMQCDKGVILLLHEGEVVLSVEQGLPAHAFGEDNSAAVRKLVDWIVEQGAGAIISNVVDVPYVDQAWGIDPATVLVGVPIKVRGEVLGAIGIFQEPDEPQLTMNEINLLTTVADHAGVVAESARLRQLTRETAVSEERQRLARELHDSVTQLVYSINLFAKAGQDAYELGRQQQGHDYLTSIKSTATQTLKEMRLLIYELVSPTLAEEGLLKTIQRRLTSVEGASGIDGQLLTDITVDIPLDIERELFFIVQEALNNTLKHAEASQVTVHITSNRKGLELKVSDNGKGFNPQEPAGEGGYGLSNMRQRAENLGGELSILSETAKQGTSVVLFLSRKALGEALS